MLRKCKYKKELQNHTKNLGKDYISYVLSANFEDDQHSMLLEEENFIWANALMPFPNEYEYSILEKVDLIDLRNCYGRNKKRRSLLCRP